MQTLSAASHALRYAWAAPCSMVGLLLALAALASGATARSMHGTFEVAGGRIPLLVSRLPKILRFSAITFGHVILGVSHAALDFHRGHEHVHVRQYERWGILFFPLYCGSSLVQLVRGRNFYLDNRFEREAHSLTWHFQAMSKISLSDPVMARKNGRNQRCVSGVAVKRSSSRQHGKSQE